MLMCDDHEHGKAQHLLCNHAGRPPQFICRIFPVKGCCPCVIEDISAQGGTTCTTGEFVDQLIGLGISVVVFDAAGTCSRARS